jgi:hypothetical protein
MVKRQVFRTNCGLVTNGAIRFRPLHWASPGRYGPFGTRIRRLFLGNMHRRIGIMTWMYPCPSAVLLHWRIKEGRERKGHSYHADPEPSGR